jgi:hypothetical protein
MEVLTVACHIRRVAPEFPFGNWQDFLLIVDDKKWQERRGSPPVAIWDGSGQNMGWCTVSQPMLSFFLFRIAFSREAQRRRQAGRQSCNLECKKRFEAAA